MSEFGSLSRPPIVQKRVGPNWVRRRFRPIDYSLNPVLDLGFGSAISLNFDPNLGPVQVGSGSNAVQNRTSASLPLVEVPICPLECIIADNKSGLVNEGSKHRVSSNNKFDGAFHPKVPDILLFRLKVLQILVVLLNNAWNDPYVSYESKYIQQSFKLPFHCKPAGASFSLPARTASCRALLLR